VLLAESLNSGAIVWSVLLISKGSEAADMCKINGQLTVWEEWQVWLACGKALPRAWHLLCADSKKSVPYALGTAQLPD
jgi:hypothetical protein